MSGYVKAGATFLKNLLKGGKQKTTGREVISSVPVSKNVKKYGVDYSKAKTRLDASYQRGLRVDKNYKTMKEAKEAFKGAKKDLQKMVDTGRATKINKRVHRKGVDYKSEDLFPTKKKNFNKGGRVGLKGGSFPDLSGDGKTTFKDILIGRGVIKKGKKKTMMAKKSETPMDKAVKKDKKKKRVI